MGLADKEADTDISNVLENVLKEQHAGDKNELSLD